MGGQANTTTDQAQQKQSREERKIEKKFKSLTADCEKYRKKHGSAPVFCEAVEQGAVDVDVAKAEDAVNKIAAERFNAFTSGKFDPERDKQLFQAEKEARERHTEARGQGARPKAK